MVNDERVRAPRISHQLAIFCLLHLGSCSQSLDRCHSSKMEPDGTSNPMTHVAHQFEINVSTGSEVLPLEIPKRLLFNYKMNLFKSEIDKLSFQEKILLANMKRTIAVFQNMIGHAPEVEMWDDQQCRTALNKLPMKEAHGLADDFDKEEVGMIKSDLCRLVMLYNTGGYYFDTDIAPLAALQKALDPRATFVTVKMSGISGGGKGLFQAFMATTPRHPVIKIAMLKFKAWYDLYWTPGQNQKLLRWDTNFGNIGTALVARAFDEWPASEDQSQSPSSLQFHQGGHVSQFFDEWQFELQGGRVIPVAQFKHVREDNCPCGVVDWRTRAVVMLCRIYDGQKGKVCKAAKFPVDFPASFLGLPSP